jgi:DNA-binding PadR family transcriptional regulator
MGEYATSSVRMSETTLDRQLLRRVRSPGHARHAYAIAQELAAEDGPDRATVYRRLQSLERRGLVQARSEAGRGARRRVLRLTPRGEEVMRAELRDAVRLLLEAFAAEQPRGGGGASRVDPPVVFVSGPRISGVEARIVRFLSRAHPRRVHLVVPPGVDAPAPGLAPLEAPWSSLPFRDGYARTLFVNELPPTARGALDRAAAEWARVLSPGGRGFVIAPAPLPRGVDPFVDFFAQLQGELFPGQAAAADVARVEAALRGAFDRVERHREAGQLVWSVRRHPSGGRRR